MGIISIWILLKPTSTLWNIKTTPGIFKSIKYSHVFSWSDGGAARDVMSATKIVSHPRYILKKNLNFQDVPMSNFFNSGQHCCCFCCFCCFCCCCWGSKVCCCCCCWGLFLHPDEENPWKKGLCTNDPPPLPRQQITKEQHMITRAAIPPTRWTVGGWSYYKILVIFKGHGA